MIKLLDERTGEELQLQVLHLEPDDMIVLTCAVELSYAQCDQAKRMLKNLFLHHQAIVLDEGEDLSVIREGERTTEGR